MHEVNAFGKLNEFTHHKWLWRNRGRGLWPGGLRVLRRATVHHSAGCSNLLPLPETDIVRRKATRHRLRGIWQRAALPAVPREGSGARVLAVTSVLHQGESEPLSSDVWSLFNGWEVRLRGHPPTQLWLLQLVFLVASSEREVNPAGMSGLEHIPPSLWLCSNYLVFPINLHKFLLLARWIIGVQCDSADLAFV